MRGISTAKLKHSSIIGHELATDYGLVEWFLAQRNSVRGYKQAIFSGFPTVVFVELLLQYVIANPSLSGLYHVSAEPISKYDLLTLIKTTYKRDIEIIPDTDVKVDRSLNSDNFRRATGFQPTEWPEMINRMSADRITYENLKP
jgi:dTDP-4-dehydrorhamnose reductase